MNVCILGQQSEQLDEGMKNYSIQLHRHLCAAGIESTLIDLRKAGRWDFLNDIRRCDPDIIHLVPGPTGKGLALLKTLSVVKRAKSVATVTQPRFNRVSRKLLSHLKPSLVYIQSDTDLPRFEQAGCRTKFLPSGVDLTRFTPSSMSEQTQLRDELSLPKSERIFLHVGHFKQGRGIKSLLKLQSFGHVVVVGSPSTGPETELVESLRSDGITVQTDYVPDIEKYYQASDVYVFPVTNETNSIRSPLSIFEAMACDLPIVMTRFGGITDLFEEGDGLQFVNSFDNIGEDDLQFERVATREKVSQYSWESIVDEIVETYEGLCNEEP